MMNKMMVDYKADISPDDAWQMLKNNNQSMLIDVRREEEWKQIGYPDVSSLGDKIIKLTLDENFASSLSSLINDKAFELLFICAAGSRSSQAALMLTELGYKNCYNIVGGFSGYSNEISHATPIRGWQASGLPWKRD
jgi:rhodanese-related sulfurtransferase